MYSLAFRSLQLKKLLHKMWNINKGLFFCTSWPLSVCSIFLIRAYAVFLFLLQSWLHYNDICAAVLWCILRGSHGTSGGLSDFEHWGTIYSPRNSIGRIFWIIWKTQKDAYLYLQTLLTDSYIFSLYMINCWFIYCMILTSQCHPLQLFEWWPNSPNKWSNVMCCNIAYDYYMSWYEVVWPVCNFWP